LADNPYLSALENGAMSLAEFRRSQEQFAHAVVFFPRPMAALVAKIPDPQKRLAILENLVEEHGDFQEECFHRSTFGEFLRRMGARPIDDVENEGLWPALRAFNAVLIAACVLDEVEVGVATMGIIELAFAGISARIGQAIVKRGWI